MVDVRPPERRAHVTLSDGRRLAWSEWGRPDGRPIVFCAGAGCSGALGFGAAALSTLGLRLLAIDRPGLGASDPHPAKTFASWADDLTELIAQQALREVAVVGFSQGAPFALALAARGLVRSAAIVSGQDELAHPRVTPTLHPDVQQMVRTVASDPAAFEAHFASIATADVLWELSVGMSAEIDRAIYTQEPFASAYRTALREGFAQGAQGYARDLANAFLPWPFSVETIGIPVTVWYGGHDTSGVHSPDHGATLAARIPGATRIVAPEDGGAVLWTRAADILGALR
jgi:pimeloyl-ACP methyl ester carboxylesterase